MTNEERAQLVVTYFLDNWPALLVGLAATVVTAIVVIVLTEFRKRHISKITEEKVSGWLVQKTLVFFSLLFAGLEYLIPLVQNNITVLGQIKWIGPYFVSVLAVSQFIYAYKGKSVMQGFLKFLEQRRERLAASDAQQSEQSQPLVQPTLTQPDNPFEATV